MSKTRLKTSATSVPVPRTRVDMENLVGQIATLKREEARQKNTMDSRIAVIKNAFEEDLNQIAADLKPLLTAAEAWAASHPEEFGKAKSILMMHGKVGFRTGTPKLALLSKWTWARVLAAIEQLGFQFIRRTPEVDKESILAFYAADQNKELVQERVLTPIGVKVVQDESFYVEPLMTEVEKRETVEAA